MINCIIAVRQADKTIISRNFRGTLKELNSKHKSLCASNLLVGDGTSHRNQHEFKKLLEPDAVVFLNKYGRWRRMLHD